MFASAIASHSQPAQDYPRLTKNTQLKSADHVIKKLTEDKNEEQSTVAGGSEAGTVAGFLNRSQISSISGAINLVESRMGLQGTPLLAKNIELKLAASSGLELDTNYGIKQSMGHAQEYLEGMDNVDSDSNSSPKDALMEGVILTSGLEKWTHQQKKIDDSGRCSLEVSPSENSLYAIAASTENFPDLKFLHLHVDIAIRNSVLRTAINQVQVSIIGTVVCNDKCGLSVAFAIVLRDGKSPSTLISPTNSWVGTLTGGHELNFHKSAEATTRAAGFYIAEPLYDDIDYNEEASRFGYHIKHVGPHSISCQKLGQSGDGDRNTAERGERSIIFDNITPGSFHLQFLLLFAVKEVTMKGQVMKVMTKQSGMYWEGRGARMKWKWKIMADSYHPPLGQGWLFRGGSIDRNLA